MERERKIIFTGDISAELVFDGSEDVIISAKVKKSDSADSDGDGKNISETYATKEELNNVEGASAKKSEVPFSFSVEEIENIPCLILTDSAGKKYLFRGENYDANS